MFSKHLNNVLSKRIKEMTNQISNNIQSKCQATNLQPKRAFTQNVFIHSIVFLSIYFYVNSGLTVVCDHYACVRLHLL